RTGLSGRESRPELHAFRAGGRGAGCRTAAAAGAGGAEKPTRQREDGDPNQLHFKKWEGTPADIEVRAGDTLTIPKRPNFVLVSGQVYNASAITYAPGKNAGWYLKQAGGVTNLANKKAIFIVRANGSVIGEGSGSGWWGGGVLSTRLQPGDTIVVPERILTGSPLFRDPPSTAQIASSMAIAARVATSF